MNRDIRSKLDMGDRAHAFGLAHPSDDPAVTGLVTRLGGKLERGHTLAMQEVTGRLTVHSSVDNKDEIRALIRENLHILSAAADLAGVDEPGLDVVFRLPHAHASHHAFLTSTKATLAQAESRRDQFIAQGMPTTLLDDLNGLVAQYEEAVDDKQLGTNAHVGANADLEAVAREIMMIVDLLDRVYAVRFRKNAELLAAWNSAREVVGPARSTPEEETTPEVPGGGEVESAA